jgi:acyl dehydratase
MKADVGDKLPDLVVPISSTQIIAGAMASRDYYPVHHDVHFAQAAGSPDVLMNILTSNGLVGRFVTDWSGPNSVIERISIRLGVPNYVGDTMTLSGEVIETLESGAHRLRVRGSNDKGDHVAGEVDVRINPTGAE